MTVGEFMKKFGAVGGSFEIVSDDRIRATIPEDTPPELRAYIRENKAAIKAAVLHQPTITIEPIRLPPGDGQDRLLRMVRSAVDDGAIRLTGKIKYHQCSGIIEIEYAPLVPALDWGRYWE